MINILECPVCNSRNISLKYRVPDRHYRNEGMFTLDRCKDCGLVFLNPMYTDEELGKFYPEESYYAYHTEFDKVPVKNSFKRRLLNFFLLESGKKNIPDGENKKVLDIGCGNGWVLNQYRQKGWSVFGVEPGMAAAEAGNKAGLNIFHGTLLQAKFNANEFDLILTNHSFEHIYNPNEVLLEVFRILKPDGKIVMGIPNYSGLNRRITGKYWYFLGAPVHTFNYSVNNIKLLFAKQNFKVTGVRHVSGLLGIIGSFQIFLNRRNKKTSEEGFFINSKFFRLAGHYISKFQNLIKVGDCIEVTAVKNSIQEKR